MRVYGSVYGGRHNDVLANIGQKHTGAKEAETPKEEINERNKLITEKSMKELDKEDAKSILGDLEEFEKFIDMGFSFQIHEGTDRVRVEVIDIANDEIIREIPPEKILDIVSGLKDLVGLFLDEKI